ncbi:MAG: EAL domain-containing protein [Treponema sp.]|nr:EAL domain-containing protein [Treponema sp.]
MLRLLPIILVGSIALAIDSLFISISSDFFQPFQKDILHKILLFTSSYTVGFLSIYLAFSMGISTAELKRLPHQEQILLGIFSTVAFIIYTRIGQGNIQDLTLTYFSVTNAIEAILLGYITICIHYKFKNGLTKHRILSKRRYHIFFNKTIAHAEGVTLIILFAVVCGLIKQYLFYKFSFTNPLLFLFHHLYGSRPAGLAGILICQFLDTLAWLFGIHGNTVVGSVLTTYFDPAMLQNITIDQNGGIPTNPYTSALISFVSLGGAGQTISLVLAILLFSKHHGSRILVSSSLVSSIFNINEPLIYGLPIMLNFLLAIPFIITPIVSILVTLACIKLGLMPIPISYASWSTPPILMGICNTHHISGGIVQLVNIVIGTLIYYPFVKINDKQNKLYEHKELHHLEHIYKKAEESVTEITLVDIPGTPGVVARFLAFDLQAEDILKQFHIVYQPQFDNNMHIFGVEALLRWKHPVFGSIYPPLVFKLASEAGVLSLIEESIFLLIQKDIASHPTLKFSVNATPYSLRDKDFISFIKRVYIDVLSHNPNVFIEVTEQSKLITDETLLDNLKQLREIGFKLAIDDFSMGHTSLRYLQDNKFDLVKLDGTFTKNMIENPKTQNIIDSIIYLGKTSGFNVLAEYVETERQKQTLNDLGCTLFQGRLCSMPVDIEVLDTMLQST